MEAEEDPGTGSALQLMRIPVTDFSSPLLLCIYPSSSLSFSLSFLYCNSSFYCFFFSHFFILSPLLFLLLFLLLLILLLLILLLLHSPFILLVYLLHVYCILYTVYRHLSYYMYIVYCLLYIGIFLEIPHLHNAGTVYELCAIL